MDIGFKIVNAVAGMAAGVAANAIIDMVWKAASGNPSPRDADKEELSTSEIVVFAVVSGTVTALFNVLSEISAQKFYRNTEQKAAERQKAEAKAQLAAANQRLAEVN